MEKDLTLYEMINYDIPKSSRLPIEEIKLHKSAWRIPKLNTTKVFETNLNNLMLRNCYKDISREKQKSFLDLSGKIVTNKKKSKSLNRMLGFLPSQSRGSQRALVSCRGKRKSSSNFNFAQKPEQNLEFRKKVIQFKFTPLGNVGSFLAKLANKGK